MGGSFHGVLVNIILITNRRTQEFKVAADFAGTIGCPKERIRELHVKPGQVDSTDGNQVALAQVELEADGGVGQALWLTAVTSPASTPSSR